MAVFRSMWRSGAVGDCCSRMARAAAVAARDSSITRRTFLSFASASSIDDFEIALIAFVKSSHVVKSDPMRSRTTSGSRRRTSGIRSPAGSGTSLARVRILFAQMTCDSSSRPSSSCHIPNSFSFKVCPFKRLLLSCADLEEPAFFGQRTAKAAFTLAHVSLFCTGMASNHSSAVLPDFSLLKKAVVFLSSDIVSFKSLFSNFLIKSCGFSPARPFP